MGLILMLRAEDMHKGKKSEWMRRSGEVKKYFDRKREERHRILNASF